MRGRFIAGFVLGITVSLCVTTLTAASLRSEGKKCECGGGDARCFFDGSRCPVSGGKCKCFKKPEAAEAPGCCCSPAPASETEAAATDFCLVRCPVKVGGVVCEAECRLKKGHSGKHSCIKLHDFSK